MTFFPLPLHSSHIGSTVLNNFFSSLSTLESFLMRSLAYLSEIFSLKKSFFSSIAQKKKFFSICGRVRYIFFQKKVHPADFRKQDYFFFWPYKEELITSPITTQTELYFFTTVVFIRNHFKKYSSTYTNVMDIVKDKSVAEILFCLMELSVTTYMQNKVVFNESEIASLKCPIPLEETGFISKYQTSTFSEVTFQFRHLILQEFLTALYLCVTENFAPFQSNREFTSCRPTIVGIATMLKSGENELFLLLFNELILSYETRIMLKGIAIGEAASDQVQGVSQVSKVFQSLHTKLFIPTNMINEEDTFFIDTTNNDCIEFLTLFKESRGNFTLPTPLPKTAFLNIMNNYKDIRNIVNVINALKIKNICSLTVSRPSYSDEEMHLISKTPLGEKYVIEIDICRSARSFSCEPGLLSVHVTPSSLKSLPGDLLEKSTSIYVEVILIQRIDQINEIASFFHHLAVSFKKPIILKSWSYLDSENGSLQYFDKQSIRSFHVDMCRIDICT
eukprot:TCONS_00062324-protein